MSKANNNGNKFENDVCDGIERVFEIQKIRNNGFETADYDCFTTQLPYITIFGSGGRSDIMIKYKGKTAVFECKYQDVKGSVDQKICYVLGELKEAHNCDFAILLIKGNGIRKEAIKYFEKKAEKHNSKH